MIINPRLKLFNKNDRLEYIEIYDDLIQFNLGSKFVAVHANRGEYRLLPLEEVIEKFMFPKEGNKLPIITRYLKGLDDELFNKIDFYNGKVK